MISNKDQIKELISCVSSIDVQYLYKLNALENLIKSYENGNKEQREVIREVVYEMKANLLCLSLSELLSCEAYNMKKIDYIVQALMLHSIEDFRWDPRENIIYLSIIWFVIGKLNIDYKYIFECVISISSERTQSYLNEFINRPKEIKTLKSMGLKSIIKNNILSFEQEKPSWM